MVLVIDNYDSFTYNLVQYLGELGAEVVVRRNDEVTVDAARGTGAGAHRDFAGAGPAGAGGRHARGHQRVRRRACRCWACAWATRRSAWRLAATSCARRCRCTARPRRSSTTARACSPGITASFQAGRYHSLVVGERRLARRARGRGATEGRRPRDGAAPPHVADARRAVPPRVGPHQRGPPHPPQLPRAVTMFTALIEKLRPARRPHDRRGRGGDGAPSCAARRRRRRSPGCSSAWR